MYFWTHQIILIGGEALSDENTAIDQWQYADVKGGGCPPFSSGGIAILPLEYLLAPVDLEPHSGDHGHTVFIKLI